MARRLAWVCLAGLGLCSFTAAESPPDTPAAQITTAPEGQDDLTLAATCLDRGENTAAAAHLSRHLAAHPDRPLVRFSLAELLWQRDRRTAACAEYERFVRDMPVQVAETNRLVHAHTRLMTFAEQATDGYGEHLHRGLGLYLLACQDAAANEGLLCKAAGELTLAARERPAEARPHWYLHLIWTRLGQSQPAERHMRSAAALAARSDLTPVERRGLALAADNSARPH